MISVKKLFTTVDTHTGGNPTRTVTSGLPTLIGQTMSEKMLYMKKNYDWIRKFLMNEPRGHGVMSGVLLTDPCHPDADIGVIFIETGGYLPMCGHDTIGVCTALIETGLIEAQEPVTFITLDTPAGIVKTEILVENGKAKQVTFKNIESFLYKSIRVMVENIGEVHCDIAYGGNFYGIVDAREIDLELVPANASKIIDTAISIRKSVNKQHEIVHPELSFIRGLTHIEFFTDPTHKEAHVKNTVVVPPGGIDRSPCGTGTAAKMATLYQQSKLKVGEEFVHESIVGSLFKGKIVETSDVKGFTAIIPEISGSAWLMGFHSFLYNEDDLLNEGFLLIPPANDH
jgi:proline racemase